MRTETQEIHYFHEKEILEKLGLKGKRIASIVQNIDDFEEIKIITR